MFVTDSYDVTKKEESQKNLSESQSITLDKNEDIEIRLARYLAIHENPYQVKCGNVTVNMTFNKTGKLLETLLAEYFINQK